MCMSNYGVTPVLMEDCILEDKNFLNDKVAAAITSCKEFGYPINEHKLLDVLSRLDNAYIVVVDTAMILMEIRNILKYLDDMRILKYNYNSGDYQSIKQISLSELRNIIRNRGH